MSDRPEHVHPIAQEGAGVPADAAPERIVAGSGVARAWNAFTGADGRFHAGVWQAEPGVLEVRYSETELCVLVEGRVRLSDAHGSVEYGPGEAFLIAPGFDGRWESIGRVTKFYAVLEAGQEPEASR
jgi:uncharacterized cupin superfamily protein